MEQFRIRIKEIRSILVNGCWSEYGRTPVDVIMQTKARTQAIIKDVPPCVFPPKLSDDIEYYVLVFGLQSP